MWVKNNKWKNTKTSIINSGYLKVTLSNESKNTTRTIHQLVAISFLGHDETNLKLVVNHIDFNKQNNHVENLEVVTYRENSNHRPKIHSSDYPGVYWREKTQKWQVAIRINGKKKYLGSFDCEIEASESYQKALRELWQKVNIKLR